MTLGELITALEAADPNQIVEHGFTHPHSYRGDYMDLAFEPATDVPVHQLLACARSALGATYHGYKGGEFLMDEHADCWLAKYGDLGETLGPLLVKLMLAPAMQPPAGVEWTCPTCGPTATEPHPRLPVRRCSNCKEHAPAVDQSKRRDRYDAAIREADGWVLDDGQHMIDAVMAVADAEQAELRVRLATAERIRENADFHLGQEMARRQLAEKEVARLLARVAELEQPDAVPAVDRTDLRDRIADVLAHGDAEKWGTKVPAEDHPFWRIYLAQADAVLAVLPEPDGRAAVYAEVADRLATDAEKGEKEGFTRIYRRSAAKQVRNWADELRRMADEAQQGSVESVRCVRPEAHPAHVHSALRKGVAVHGRCSGDSQQPRTCGRTWSVSGHEYSPCARLAGHSETYCRTADGQAYFLGTDEAQQGGDPS